MQIVFTKLGRYLHETINIIGIHNLKYADKIIVIITTFEFQCKQKHNIILIRTY